MITSLEIEEGLAARLESEARARGISTRDFIRSALQEAVEAPRPTTSPARFTQRIHDFGTHVESPWTLLVDIEGEEYFRKYGRK